MKSSSKKHLVIAMAVALGVTLLPQSASAASVLYGSTGSGNTPSSLYTIDPTTGGSTLVGAIGFNEVVSIDFDPISGSLYGIANNGGAPAQLIKINTATGAGTLVAALSPSFQSPDMSFSPSGTLYSWSEPSPDHLNTVNITTGATADVGPSGISTAQLGLDVNSAGTIYVKSGNDVYTVSPVTGSATFVISLTGPTSPSFDNVLAFDPANTLYTVDRRTGNSDLYTINLTTGATTLIGATGLERLGALAFSPSSVPDGGATLLLLGLAVPGLAAFRRLTSRRAS